MPLSTDVDAEALDQRVDAPLARHEAGDQRLEVAPVLLGDAAVGQDHVEQVPVHRAAHEQLLRRQAQPLLEDLARPRRDARRHQPADVRAVEEARPVADQAALPEDRAHEVQVGQMGGGGRASRTDRW